MKIKVMTLHVDDQATGSTSAMLEDTCGNLVQIAALDGPQS